jgi:aerobic C4-dicarboxylate transport protein
VLVGTWTREFDRDKANRVLSGDDPFDEATMLDDVHGTSSDADPAPASSEPATPGDGTTRT